MFKAHLFRIRSYESRDLDAVKSLFLAGIELHRAQQNFAACRLHERHGFVPVTHLTHQPLGVGDVLYRWPGS